MIFIGIIISILLLLIYIKLREVNESIEASIKNLHIVQDEIKAVKEVGKDVGGIVFQIKNKMIQIFEKE